MQQELTQFVEYMYQKRYSENTIKTYREALRVFLQFIGDKPLLTIDNTDLERFNYQRIIQRGLSSSYQNQVINALKLYFRKFHNKHFDLDRIERPKEGYKLPVVFSLHEVERLIQSIENVKHKSMISMIYSCGLRCGELINLRIEDIDSNRMIVTIRGAKGNKDRIVPLSQSTLELLRTYFRAYRPSVYLFNGESSLQYSPTSLRKVFHRAKENARILKKSSLHTLRH